VHISHILSIVISTNWRNAASLRAGTVPRAPLPRACAKSVIGCTVNARVSSIPTPYLGHGARPPRGLVWDRRNAVPVIAHSLSDLSRVIQASPREIIGIDGYYGAGKTTLADALSAAIGIRNAHLDDYLHRHQGSYVSSLRFPDLSVALRNLPVIVEGLCLLAVLDQLGMKPDLLIYVDGGLPDSHAGSAEDSELARELLDYHRKWRPADAAHVLYSAKPALEGDVVSSTKADVDVAFIQAKTRLAITLAIGGMVSLIVGMSVLLYGVSEHSEAIFKTANFEQSV
jgi:hypothetical protein